MWETGGASSPTTFSPQRHAFDGGGLFKYVVLYASTLVLQPVLAVVLTLGALWGLWKVLMWVFLSRAEGVDYLPARPLANVSNVAPLMREIFPVPIVWTLRSARDFQGVIKWLLNTFPATN